MATVTLYLVRHGQTYLNKYHRIQGWSDSPLTTKGEADAARAGQRLSDIHFAAAYASDTARAQNTAKAILAANTTPVTLTTEPAFREVNFGYFEGLDAGFTWHTLGSPLGYDDFNTMIANMTIEKTKDLFHAQDPWGDAEDNATFWARVQPGLDHAVATAKDGDNLLIATHSTTIRSIVSKYSDVDVSIPVKNGSITQLVVTDGHYSVTDYNNSEGPLA